MRFKRGMEVDSHTYMGKKKKKSKNPYEGEDTSWGDTKGRGLRVAVFRVGPFQLRILHSVLFLWSQIC